MPPRSAALGKPVEQVVMALSKYASFGCRAVLIMVKRSPQEPNGLRVQFWQHAMACATLALELVCRAVQYAGSATTDSS